MRSQKGFTLIELLVAMAIIGLLIGMTIFGVSRAFQASRDTKRQNLAREIQTAIVSYEGKYSNLPPTITTVQDTSSGKTTLTVGTGTKSVTLEYAMLVYNAATNPPPNPIPADSAYFCYNNNVGGTYALGVMLEDRSMYYMTTQKCPGYP